MKNKHTEGLRLNLRERWEQSPHRCHNPNCPGDLNRRRLELFDEMLFTLISAGGLVYRHWTLGGSHDFDSVIAKASELKAKQLK